MHYNNGERIKLKRHIPWKWIITVVVVVAAGLVLYLVLNNNETNLKNPPTGSQNAPA